MQALHGDVYRPDGTVGRHGRRESTLIRSVNKDLRQRSETLANTERIAFFCECDDAACYAPVWLTATTYDETVDAESEWLLLDGHEPSGGSRPQRVVAEPNVALAGSRLQASLTASPSVG